MSKAMMPQAPTGLRCEYVTEPLGVESPNPRLSWILRHDGTNQYQTAYQVVVADELRLAQSGQGNVWDSGKVDSNQSVNIRLAGKLEPHKTYYWRVRWWDKDGQESGYSKIAAFETGFLSEDGWAADWIANGADADHSCVTTLAGYELRPGSLFRKEFVADKKVRRARAYVAGLGYYELRLNGEKVGDRVLDPGQTDYRKTVLYSVYDITRTVQEGANAIGLMLGNGRFVRFHWNNQPQGYDAFPQVRAEFHMEFEDGTETRIVTDETWQVARGPIGVNGIYQGEVYDARLEIEGWDRPGLTIEGWAGAVTVSSPGGAMRSQLMPPIKVTRRLQPVLMNSPEPGVYVYDFGQNFTGWVKLKAKGPAGAAVQLKYAEVLGEDGMLDTRINRGAAAVDTYVLKGEGLEEYEPRFTYHGFRYVEVTGYPGTPALFSLEGCFVHTAVEQTGQFACSNDLFNTIHRNVIYGQLANLMSVPTDCPQRDERMGWMGDAQLTAEEAIHNFDMAAFYVKYLQDIKDSQREDGSLSDVVPNYWPLYPADPAWGTAYVVLAWEMYRYYKDVDLLREHYGGLKKYVESLRAKEDETGLVSFIKYGDWCPPGSIPPKKTPRDITSAFSYYHDVLTLGRIAAVIGEDVDASFYADKAAAIRAAFNRKYFNEAGKFYGNNDQTSNVLGLQLGLVPDGAASAVVDNLVKGIADQNDYHFDTGIVGIKFILDTLSRYGKKETAYRMMNKQTYPSFGYMIKEGATTVWERWEKLTGGGMNSHNHIMFGTVDVWFFRTLAGISLGRPGWEEVVIKPIIPDGIDHASGSLESVQGVIHSSWSKQGDGFAMEVEIPVNVKAKVLVPNSGRQRVTVQTNGEPMTVDVPQTVTDSGETYYRFEVGSGRYRFELS